MIKQHYLFYSPVHPTDSLSRIAYKTSAQEKNEQPAQLIGTGSLWNFTHYTIQPQRVSSIFPVVNQWEATYYYWTQTEPQVWRLDYGDIQYSGCGSNTSQAFYCYFQEWHLDKNKRVKKIIAGNISNDTTRKRMPVTESLLNMMKQEE